ncbi:50S ribosomal protein L5 [Candidatus Uhrbacteria bacterium]|nr:50S ribosomal protein L5 [Candidatus Uhrbacteria bacterium]
MTLKERYQQDIVPKLQAEFGLRTRMAVPRIGKVVVNVGMSQALRDPKIGETVIASLTRITGQRPVRTLARKSIAAFKVRQGQAIGAVVTLRGPRMWDFLEKLIRVTLPRVRDFRGVARSAVDQSGNLSIGFREHAVFPEIRSDDAEQLHGVQVTVVTGARSHERGLVLFKALGVPFQEVASRKPPARPGRSVGAASKRA